MWPLSWKVRTQCFCHVNELLVNIPNFITKWINLNHCKKEIFWQTQFLIWQQKTCLELPVGNLKKRLKFQTTLPRFHWPNRYQLPSKLIAHDYNSQFENCCSFVWIITNKTTHVDLMVMHRSCSSFLVSVNLVSPAFCDAIIPALLTKESVSVDLPWSTCAITDMFRMLCFLSIMDRIWK